MNLFDAIGSSDPATTRHGGNPQSVEAYESLRDSLSHDLLAVLECVVYCGVIGRTLDEVSEMLKRPPNAISGRFTQLAAKGLIVRSGDLRITRSGRRAAVWIATAQGRLIDREWA